VILDEVIKRFSCGAGGAARLYGIQADLTTLERLSVRIAGRSIRWASGRDGHARAERACLSSGHAVGEPVGDGGRGSQHGRAFAEWHLTKNWNSTPHCFVDEWKKVVTDIMPVSGRCSARFSQTAKCGLCQCKDQRYEAVRAVLPCDGWNAGVHLAPSQFEVGFVVIGTHEQDLEQTVRAAAGSGKGAMKIVWP